MGFNVDALTKLQRQMENLEITLNNCSKARQHCKEILEEGNSSLNECEAQIKSLLESLDGCIKRMKSIGSQLSQNPHMWYTSDEDNSVIKSTVHGVISGARKGEETLPSLGVGVKAIGGAFGGAGGFVSGLFSEFSRSTRVLLRQFQVMTTKNNQQCNMMHIQRGYFKIALRL